MHCFALHPDALCRNRRLSHPATALFTPATSDKTVFNVYCRRTGVAQRQSRSAV
jgi:hypothetical protein